MSTPCKWFNVEPMKTSHIFILKFIKGWALLLGTALFIVGCSTDFSGSGSNFTATPEQAQASAERFMELARGATGNTAIEYRLRAAEGYIHAQRIEEAGQLFREIQASEFSTANVNLSNNLNTQILEARLALLKQDSPRALNLVHNMLDTVTGGRSTQAGYSDGGAMTVAGGHGKKIALLLPSKGPHAEAAKTIREGFFAAFYNTQQPHSINPSIKVYDTNDGKEVESAYHQAVADNSDIIVGPLTKQEVQTIANISGVRTKQATRQSTRNDIPVLALNSINSKGSRTLYQFGLMPEDEVLAVAEHARRQGHQRALVIAPQNEWGQRMSKAFTQAWTSRGGQIVGVVALHNANADHEEQSAQIQSALQTGTGKNTQRKNIDMVFLAASPEVGRRIKPLIGFYGSIKLPVYATSNVYSGHPAPNKDQDLNGIHFCDMPWVLNPDHIKQVQDSHQSRNHQAATKLGSNTAHSPKYFALGLDAYRLAQQISETQALSITGTHGATGDLRLEGQRIQRQLTCAKFANGVPVPD